MTKPTKHTTPYRRRVDTKHPSMYVHIFYGVCTLLVAAALGAGVWYLTRLPSVTLSEVRIEGSRTVQIDEVEKQINRALTGSYAFLIPYRFSFLYPKDSVLAAVAAIDRVHTVRIVREGNTTLKVSFTEYEPFALWCERVTNDNSPCYFLDQTGYAFSRAPELEGGSFIRYYKEGMMELRNTQVFEHESFSAMHRLASRLSDELGLRIVKIAESEAGDLDVYVSGGGMLRFAEQKDGEYGEVLSNLKLILASPKFKHIKPGNFGYIDLRFGNKVFVREKPETHEENLASSSASTSTRAE